MKVSEIVAICNMMINLIRLIVDFIRKNDNKKDRH